MQPSFCRISGDGEGFVMPEELYVYDPALAPGAKAIKAELGAKVEIEPVICAATLETALKKYTNIKMLTFDTHGGPGHLSLPKASRDIDAPVIQGIGVRCPSLMVPSGRILFLGCNVGEGADGDTFIAGVAMGFLKGKGGTVGAATGSVYAHHLFGVEWSPSKLGTIYGNRLKVVRFDATPREVGRRSVDSTGVPD
jgi:hypothetical protein